MRVWLNSIDGIPDALTSMYMSKRTWTREKEMEIRKLCHDVLYSNGTFKYTDWSEEEKQTLAMPIRANIEKYGMMMDTLCRIGIKHITLLKFIDFSFTVEGIHRAGQDDWDAHAERYNNRIIRMSTRLTKDVVKQGEKSEFYQDKILTVEEAFDILEMKLPDSVEKDGVTYVKTTNGYIREDMKDNQDVKRGLYMLSLPSNFIFKVNLTEWAHVYKQRNKNGGANPEVKELCEMICDLLESAQPNFTRDLFAAIEN